MEEDKFINDLQNNVSGVILFPNAQSIYDEIIESLRGYKIISYHIKARKSTDPPIVDNIESLFFDNKLIHWLIINSTSIIHNIYPINKINLVHYSSNNDKKSIGFREQANNNIDEFKLIINFSGADQNTIIINSDSSEFSKLLVFKNNLLAQI